jgi:septum formation protein
MGPLAPLGATRKSDLSSPAPIILASASARRRDLLTSAGIRFEAIPSDIDELPLPGEPPADFVARMALDKAEEVHQRRLQEHDQRPVLGADTTVVIDDTMLGKPADAADARRMLLTLSGRTHEVLTGICLRTSAEADQHVVATSVTFITLAEDDIERYLARAAWHDKAGAYAIQEHAAYMVRHISGSYTNVVGLPLAETVFRLRRAGVLA